MLSDGQQSYFIITTVFMLSQIVVCWLKNKYILIWFWFFKSTKFILSLTSCPKKSKTNLTLIRVAGGVYDFRNFKQV